MQLLILTLLVSGVAAETAAIENYVVASPERRLILEGIVEGFVSDQPDVKSCVGGLGVAVGDVEQGLKDILRRDLPDVAKGLREIGDALEALPSAMKACNAVKSDVEHIVQILEAFKGLKRLTIHILKDIASDSGDIVTQLKESLNAFKANNYEECGRRLGMAFHRIVVEKPVSGVAAETAAIENYVVAAPERRLILEGIVEGFVSDQPDVKSCVGGLGVAVGDVEQGLKDILRRDLPDVSKGLREIADALEALPSAMKACNAVKSDVEHIVQILEAFKGFKRLTIHIIKDIASDSGDIVTQLKESLNAFEANNYEECGWRLGMAFHRIVVEKPGPPTPPTPPTPGPLVVV